MTHEATLGNTLFRVFRNYGEFVVGLVVVTVLDVEDVVVLVEEVLLATSTHPWPELSVELELLLLLVIVEMLLLGLLLHSSFPDVELVELYY